MTLTSIFLLSVSILDPAHLERRGIYGTGTKLHWGFRSFQGFERSVFLVKTEITRLIFVGVSDCDKQSMTSVFLTSASISDPSHIKRCNSYRGILLTCQAAIWIYRNKRRFLHKSRVQYPEERFGTTTWSPWRHVETLYNSIYGTGSILYSDPLQEGSGSCEA